MVLATAFITVSKLSAQEINTRFFKTESLAVFILAKVYVMNIPEGYGTLGMIRSDLTVHHHL